jgi:hypothetical protein
VQSAFDVALWSLDERERRQVWHRGYDERVDLGELGVDVLGLRPVVRPIALVELFLMAIGCPGRVSFRRIRLGSTPADRELGRQGDPQLRGRPGRPRGAGPAGGVDLPVVTPEQAAAAARGGEVEIVASRWLGGAWTQDRLWERLGIGAAIRRATAGVEVAERVVFALVAQRALEPASQAGGDPLGGRAGRHRPPAARHHQNPYLKLEALIVHADAGRPTASRRRRH